MEFRWYDSKGMKQFSDVDPEKFISAFQRDLARVDRQTMFNHVLANALSKAMAVDPSKNPYHPTHFDMKGFDF